MAQPPDMSAPLKARAFAMLEAFLRFPNGGIFFFTGGVVTNTEGDSTHFLQIHLGNQGFTFTTLEARHVTLGIKQIQVQCVHAPDAKDIELLALADQLIETAVQIEQSHPLHSAPPTRH